MAMQEPRSRVVRFETECNIITRVANVDDIATDRICEVVRGTTCDPYHVESVTVKMERMLECQNTYLSEPAYQIQGSTCIATPGDRYLDCFIRRESVYRAGRQ